MSQHRNDGERSASRAGSSRDGASVLRKKTSTSHRDDARMIGQWRIGRTIGKGSSGRVKIAKHAVTGKYAAVKIVPKGLILTSRMSMSEAGAKADKVMLGIEREIVIMKLIDHPNVLNLYDVWETSSELYLIMEYVPGGELFDYLVKRGRLPVSEALHYFQQIIHAVDYCHRFNICHRDLKPENLLLDKDKNIKVADFGMAAWEAGERMLETSCGSPHYASPEIVAGKAYHGSSSDIWSCGIILFALLTGRLPFDDDNIRSLLQKVKIGVFEMPDEIQGSARDLLSHMLEKDPERRITMPEILNHPFFVSRPPRPIPGRQLVSPPSLSEVERPVNSPDEIDSDILSNLKTLWTGATEEEIVDALMSREKTWEKTIYHLLIKYRTEHLENYNMDDDEEAEARARRHARREAREGRTAPSPAKRKGVPAVPTRSAQEPRLQPLGENETIQERTPSPVARPQAPTPKKAATAAVVVADEDRKLVPPRGPRPPTTATQQQQQRPIEAPHIVLQEATPTKEITSQIQRRSIIEPHSPSLPATPQIGAVAPSLNAPVVHDEQLQHFFNEVANQLNTMNIRSSVTSGSSSTHDAMQSDYAAYMPFVNGLQTSQIGTPHEYSHELAFETEREYAEPIEIELGQQEQLDPNQFADADDDESELASEYSHAPSTMVVSPQSQSSPLAGLGFGVPPIHARPGLYPGPSPQPNRWSYASSTGSSRQPTESPQMYSPRAFSPQPAPELAAPVSSWQARRPAPPPPTASRPAPAPPRPPKRVEVPKEDETESLLPRDGSYVVIDNADVPASDSSWGSKQSGFSAHRNAQDAFGRLKKRTKKVSTIDAVPWAPNFSGSLMSGPSSNNSPKRSWFNNLFSFKPASCTLLAHDNVSNTRERTKRALTDLGVRVAVVEIDGLRALKCRLDEVRDPQGNTTVVKGVRFKVEFARSSPASTTGSGNGGYNTLVSLTQEKGAQSSFKGVFNSLKSILESAPTTTTTNSNSNRGSGGLATPRLASSVGSTSPQLPPLSPVFSTKGQYLPARPETVAGSPYIPPYSPNSNSYAPQWPARSAPSSPAIPHGRFTPSPQMAYSPHLPTAIRL